MKVVFCYGFYGRIYSSIMSGHPGSEAVNWVLTIILQPPGVTVAMRLFLWDTVSFLPGITWLLPKTFAFVSRVHKIVSISFFGNHQYIFLGNGTWSSLWSSVVLSLTSLKVAMFGLEETSEAYRSLVLECFWRIC